jgi:Mn-dependent DtxR family transcriptional regulator
MRSNNRLKEADCLGRRRERPAPGSLSFFAFRRVFVTAVGGKTGQSAGPSAKRWAVRAKRRQPKPAAQDRSESTEDHLERIQELVDHKGYARVADIAAALGLSRSTVSNMVRRLAARGYVNYERYRGLTLTPAGQQVAQHIKARDQTLTQLLELLGLAAETVRHEVEGIEHHLRPETLALFAKLVSFWQEQPSQLAAFKRFNPKS